MNESDKMVLDQIDGQMEDTRGDKAMHVSKHTKCSTGGNLAQKMFHSTRTATEKGKAPMLLLATSECIAPQPPKEKGSGTVQSKLFNRPVVDTVECSKEISSVTKKNVGNGILSSADPRRNICQSSDAQAGDHASKSHDLAATKGVSAILGHGENDLDHDSLHVGLLFDPRFYDHCIEVGDHYEDPERGRLFGGNFNQKISLEACCNVRFCSTNFSLQLRLFQYCSMGESYGHLISSNLDNSQFLIAPNSSIVTRKNQNKNRITRLDQVWHSPLKFDTLSNFLWQICEAVARGEVQSAVALVRPPGHHAEFDRARGFCIFNNNAIAATHLLESDLGINKIMMLDWDIHHGNGIQKMFWKDPRVLYLSLHRYDEATFYPCSEEANYDMIGEGPGEGFNINVPFSKRSGCDDVDYLAVWEHVVLPVALEYNPDIILISAGFDAEKGQSVSASPDYSDSEATDDPVGLTYRITPQCFARLLEKLMGFARGKIVMTLEGGYDPDSLANCVLSCVKTLLGDKKNYEDLDLVIPEDTKHLIKLTPPSLIVKRPVVRRILGSSYITVVLQILFQREPDGLYMHKCNKTKCFSCFLTTLYKQYCFELNSSICCDGIAHHIPGESVKYKEDKCVRFWNMAVGCYLSESVKYKEDKCVRFWNMAVGCYLSIDKYQIQNRQKITCACNKVYTEDSMCRIIELTCLGAAGSLMESINLYKKSTIPEYDCSQCLRKQLAFQETEFTSLGEVVCFKINRQIGDVFSFPMVLTLHIHNKYNLVGVISVSKAKRGGGLYRCIVKTENGWFNDEGEVTKVDGKKKDACMLIYEKEKDASIATFPGRQARSLRQYRVRANWGAVSIATFPHRQARSLRQYRVRANWGAASIATFPRRQARSLRQYRVRANWGAETTSSGQGLIATFPRRRARSLRQYCVRANRGAETTGSVRQGLIFPVGQTRRGLKIGYYARRVSRNAAIYLAATIQYVVEEVLRLAGSVAKANSDTQIQPLHLLRVLTDDEELKKLIGGAIIPRQLPFTIEVRVQSEELPGPQPGRFLLAALARSLDSRRSLIVLAFLRAGITSASVHPRTKILDRLSIVKSLALFMRCL
ncbi:hypothetical protein IFM89_025982 [Coptis chinensis]|uniref:Histone deacetylase domain-containing protein n=1 Tax=Coptis chinensis TaxID=261450 RepID=A0A835I5H3_9MAGN|nr:hypothetical protein IFM89_025982 [Coptis chinensis]